MKPPATKEKATQRSTSRLAHRASGPTRSYPKTRVRGSRLYEAAFILAIVELTRRLHQAYAHAYDKQAADWVLPQNPVQTPPTDCQRFANMVAEIAGRHATSEGFMDEMARTFTAANNSSKAEMSANLEHALPPDRIQIGDAGFRPELRDGTNLQVRHLVGGLLYGYRHGYEGPMVGGAIWEALSPAPTGSMADVRINDFSMAWGASAEPRAASVTGYIGAVIKSPAHPGYKGFADLIRRHICE